MLTSGNEGSKSLTLHRFRIFTLQEANALLPTVSRLTRRTRVELEALRTADLKDENADPLAAEADARELLDRWAQEILDKSPLSIRLLKSSFNAGLDGQAGLQELAGNSTLLFYMTEEAQEAKNAYIEKRKPNFRKYPWLPW